MFSGLLLLALAASPPQSQYENDAMRAAVSLEESTRRAPREMLTEAEKSGYARTGSYDDCIALYRKLEASSPHARLLKIGESAEGRPLYVFVVSKDRAFTPEAARRSGKPVVLLQNGIHPGENGGKDASVMLLRDVLVSKTHVRWLDHVILLSIPVFNADGHERISPYNRINENGPAEMGFRVTSRRLNLNRDYVKADTPEMRAWLGLYTSWLPDFLIDNHVTDGSDNQYDVTIATHTEQDIAAPVGAWVRTQYLPKLESEMGSLGHVMGWYFEGATAEKLNVMTASPRYSTGYAAAQNRAALLVETHSLKSFKTRVWSHYDIMRVSIDAVAASARALREAGQRADAAMETQRPGTEVFLSGSPTGDGVPYTLRQLEAEDMPSAATGAAVRKYTSKPLNRETRLVRTLAPKTTPAAPAGYVVPKSWPEIAGLLRLHGVRLEEIPAALNGQYPMQRFTEVRFAPQPFEGRFQVTGFQTRSTSEPGIIPAGSWWVPVNQRAGKVAMHLLEPEAPDSLLRWGFFASIFEQKEYFSDYIFAPIADEMLEKDPKLREELERQKLQGRARLRWLFERSPYFERDKDLYPILRLNSKPARAATQAPGMPARRGSAPASPGR